jgi:hypothetical protein
MILCSDPKNLSWRIKENYFQSQNYFTGESGAELGARAVPNGAKLSAFRRRPTFPNPFVGLKLN